VFVFYPACAALSVTRPHQFSLCHFSTDHFPEEERCYIDSGFLVWTCLQTGCLFLLSINKSTNCDGSLWTIVCPCCSTRGHLGFVHMNAVQGEVLRVVQITQLGFWRRLSSATQKQ